MQYLFLDESGSLKKEDNCEYFAIGGILCNDYTKLKKEFINLNKQLKKKYNLDESAELKGSMLSKEEEKELLIKLQKIDDMYIVAILVEKAMLKQDLGLDNEHIYYNYLVGKLLSFLLDKGLLDFINPTKFELNIDERCLPKYTQHALQDYLNIIFNIQTEYNIDIVVNYIDSKTNYMIQIADILINTIWRYSIMRDAPLEYVRLSREKLRMLRILKPKWYRR